MTLQAKDIRILGLTQRKFGYANGKYQGRASELYNKLQERFTLLGIEMVYATGWIKALRAARTFHPVREQWRTSYHKMNNTYQAFLYRSQLAQQRLQARAGQFDLIFQLHTMQSPGKDVPYVLTMDNTRVDRARYWPAEGMSDHQRKHWMQLEKDVYQNAKFLFPWSEDTRQTLIESYDVDPDKVISTGAGANFLDPELQKTDYTSQTALFVGSDFERKGGYTLLKSWELVHKALPDATLQIVGPKTPLAPEQAGVEWLGRISDREYLRSIFKQSTVFVLPSFFEPWGNVFLEALGLGIPCIGPNRFGPKDMILHNQNGFHVEPGNVEMLADQLITLLSDPDKAQAFGKTAWQRAKNEYSWDAVLDRMTPYIYQAVENK